MFLPNSTDITELAIDGVSDRASSSLVGQITGGAGVVQNVGAGGVEL
jgi:hypothetical protein